MLYDNRAHVKITHLPSGEITICNEYSRSLWRNRDMAMRMLKGKLWAIENGAGRKETLVRSYELPRDEDILDGNVDISPVRSS